MNTTSTYTAFDGPKRLVQGSLSEVVLGVKKRIGRSDNSAVLIFSDDTGKIIDFDFQGTERDLQQRLEKYVAEAEQSVSTGPGRPKLGVVSREIALLPRHWEWLAAQGGGASATLRRILEDTIRKTSGTVSVKRLQERAYRFMSVMAGDLEGYEEALRALYKKDKKAFASRVQLWPRDVKNHVLEMAKPVFDLG